MAEDKNSVLLYCDIINTVEELTDEEAGKLFKHYLRYINDLNPEPPDKITKLVFEPIKQNLKRDLKKWEKTVEGRSKAGKASAEKRNKPKQKETKPTNVEFVEFASTNSTVIVNDNVNVNVTDNVNVIDEKDRKQFEELKFEMINSPTWLSDICRIEKIESIFLLEKLHEFLDKNIWLKKDFYKGLQEVRKHFISWLRVQLKEKSSGKKENTNPQEVTWTP